MTVEPFDRARKTTRRPPPASAKASQDWLKTVAAALAAVHQAADSDGVASEMGETLRAGCDDTLAMFADAMPYSTADCALMCLSIKQRLNVADPSDRDALDGIATDLLRIALFLGDQSGEGTLIDQLANATSSTAELRAARGHSD